MKHFVWISALASLTLSIAACSAADSGSDESNDSATDALRGGGGGTRPGSHLACNLDSQCPTGEECRRHICQVDDRASTAPGASTGGAAGTCPPGLELEIEHGVSSCKPHGGATPAPAGTTPAPATPGGTCTTNADCPAGLECEVEIEHGVTTAVCKPHGGGGGGGGRGKN